MISAKRIRILLTHNVHLKKLSDTTMLYQSQNHKGSTLKVNQKKPSLSDDAEICIQKTAWNIKKKREKRNFPFGKNKKRKP